MRIDPYAQSTQRSSPILRAFAFVLLLHAGVFFVLHSMMQTTLPVKVVEAISAHIIQEFRPPEPAKPLPPPSKTQNITPLQPSPALTSTAPTPLAQAPSAAPAITAAPVLSVPSATAPAPATPTKPATLIPASRVESSCSLPRYPAASERLREEGVVTLRFLISENGQVISGQVDKSSGYKRLDDAALAALSLCKFKPATVDGKPRQDWSALRYRWELKDD